MTNPLNPLFGTPAFPRLTDLVSRHDPDLSPPIYPDKFLDPSGITSSFRDLTDVDWAPSLLWEPENSRPRRGRLNLEDLDDLPSDWGEAGENVLKVNRVDAHQPSSPTKTVAEEWPPRALFPKKNLPPYPFRDAQGNPEGSLSAILFYLQSIGFMEYTFSLAGNLPSLKKELGVRLMNYFLNYQGRDLAGLFFHLLLFKSKKGLTGEAALQMLHRLQAKGILMTYRDRRVPYPVIGKALQEGGLSTKDRGAFIRWLEEEPNNRDPHLWLGRLDERFWRLHQDRADEVVIPKLKFYDLFSRALEEYLESRGEKELVDLHFRINGGGIEPEKIVLYRNVLENLLRRKISSTVRVNMAYAFAQVVSADLAAEMMRMMDATYGGRLKWERCLLALDGAELADILVLNDLAAEAFHAGRPVYFSAERGIRNSGFLNGKWILGDQPPRRGKYTVTLQKRGHQALILEETLDDASFISGTLVKNGLAVYADTLAEPDEAPDNMVVPERHGSSHRSPTRWAPIARAFTVPSFARPVLHFVR